jgi:hypothetical protein
VLEVFFKFSVGARERIRAPELVSELETHSQAFVCTCSRCSLGGFVGAVTVFTTTWA